MSIEAYRHLAERLNALPNGFPAAPDGAELRLLAKLFTPEEAALTARLRLTKEVPEQIAQRLGMETSQVRRMLKSMTRRGLISAGKTDAGLGYGLMPFVVGIYEMQVGNIDEEMAHLFEAYYRQAFGEMLSVQPQYHRVVPVKESIKVDIAYHPYQSAADLVDAAQAWGVMDCICRKQKNLIGDGCQHPLEVCMTLSEVPDAFANSTVIRALTHEEAQAALQKAADAGLVHSVSNNQQGLHYICNCCTCSCGILRGQAEMGIANVVAASPYINQVDEALCSGCENCLAYCQFDALAMGDDAVVQVNQVRCVGCGVCVPQCPSEALAMTLRPKEQLQQPPKTLKEWGAERALRRGIDLREVL